jgi:hypothetical protein
MSHQTGYRLWKLCWSSVQCLISFRHSWAGFPGALRLSGVSVGGKTDDWVRWGAYEQCRIGYEGFQEPFICYSIGFCVLTVSLRFNHRPIAVSPQHCIDPQMTKHLCPVQLVRI